MRGILIDGILGKAMLGNLDIGYPIQKFI